MPDYRLFAAQYDDPELATHMYQREQSLAKIEENRDADPTNGEVN